MKVFNTNYNLMLIFVPGYPNFLLPLQKVIEEGPDTEVLTRSKFRE